MTVCARECINKTLTVTDLLICAQWSVYLSVMGMRILQLELMTRLLVEVRLGIEIEIVLSPQIWESLPEF